MIFIPERYLDDNIHTYLTTLSIQKILNRVRYFLYYHETIYWQSIPNDCYCKLHTYSNTKNYGYILLITIRQDPFEMFQMDRIPDSFLKL